MTTAISREISAQRIPLWPFSVPSSEPPGNTKFQKLFVLPPLGLSVGAGVGVGVTPGPGVGLGEGSGEGDGDGLGLGLAVSGVLWSGNFLLKMFVMLRLRFSIASVKFAERSAQPCTSVALMSAKP